MPPHNQLFELMNHKPVLLLLNPEVNRATYLINYYSQQGGKGYTLFKPSLNYKYCPSDLMLWPTLVKCLQHLNTENSGILTLVPVPLQASYDADIVHFAFLMQLENPNAVLPNHWLAPN